MAVRVVDRPPMRQYLLATTPNRKTYRWGEDGPHADQIFEELTHSDSANGGYKDLTVSLARLPGVDYDDMRRGTRLELLGAGGIKTWEGRLERAPQVSGDRIVVSPAAVGYEAALTDDNSAQEIYIGGANLSDWGDPTARRQTTVPAGWKINNGGSSQLLPAGAFDPAAPTSYARVPALSHSWSSINTDGSTNPDIVESWYSGGGVQLGSFEIELLNVKGAGGGSWHNYVYGCSDDAASTFENLGDLNATSGASGWSIGPGRYFILLQSYYGALAEGNGPWEQQWRNPRVYGRSGVPIYGPYPARGVLASDVVANALGRWAPGIDFSVGPYGTIKPTQFLIPDLSFKTPTTVADITQQATRFELPEYGVWSGQNGPTFFMNPRGQREGRKRWRVRAKCAQLEDTGQQLDRVWNGVIVEGTGFDGTTIFIGPTGSGMQITSSRLLDGDPLNPANEAEIKRYAKIRLQGVCTIDGMEEAGEAFLEQSKLLDGSGRATLTGFVEDEFGAEWPYYCVEGGHEIEFLGSSIPGYRYIVDTDKTRSSRSVGLNIDAPPDSYEALMERLNAEFVGVGFAG